MKTQNRNILNHRIFKNPVFSILVVVFSSAFSGIIGNRADALLLKTISDIQEISGLPDWIAISTVGTIVLVVAVVISVLTAIPLTLAISQLNHLLDKSEVLSSFDSSLLQKSYSFLGSGQEKGAAFDAMLLSFLLEIEEMFDSDSSASIWCPDQTNREYLSMWKSTRRLESKKRFYIGAKENGNINNTGIVGKSYLEGRAISVRIQGSKKFKKFRRVSPLPTPYLSYIACPIRTIEPSSRTNEPIIGVLVIEGKNVKAFNKKEVRDLVISITERISAVMYAIDKLVENRISG
jgi:hypothetical protein